MSSYSKWPQAFYVYSSVTIANFKNQFQPLILKVLEKKIYTQKECYSFLSLLCKQ